MINLSLLTSFFLRSVLRNKLDPFGEMPVIPVNMMRLPLYFVLDDQARNAFPFALFYPVA